ncbi:hypothetical protein [Paenibacillus sp. 481]|uniref:hypothetical protein n=1 Tax=Paenibacillus sp. 481 TaxID=2835869 RepID=UPI001E64C759|nr:hypothetical protein [Paenibacillus sp. 481]UHA74251.1 hypothetical protein KIK04_03700 [Paenibacillus sp. 481]
MQTNLYSINEVMAGLGEHLAVEPAEAAEVSTLMAHLQPLAEQTQLHIPQDRAVMIAAHLVAFVRRVARNEWLPTLDEGMLEAIDVQCVQLSRELLEQYPRMGARLLDDAEIFFLAVHFEAIMQLNA